MPLPATLPGRVPAGLNQVGEPCASVFRCMWGSSGEQARWDGASALRLAVAGASVTIGSRDAGACRGGRRRAARTVAGPVHHGGGRQRGGGRRRRRGGGHPVGRAHPRRRGAVAPRLDGKVVVSVANALVKQGREMLALIPPRGSMAAALQAAAARRLGGGGRPPSPGVRARRPRRHARRRRARVLDHLEATATTVALFASIEGLRPARCRQPGPGRGHRGLHRRPDHAEHPLQGPQLPAPRRPRGMREPTVDP